MIKIYTREQPPCSYCIRAKALLKQKNIPFHEVKVGSDVSVEDVKQLFPTARTLPIILVEDVYIGGFDQLTNYLAENKSEDTGNLLLE